MRKNDKAVIIVAFIAVTGMTVATGVVMMKGIPDDSPAKTSQPSQAPHVNVTPSPTEDITQEGFYGASTEDDLTLMMQAAHQKDAIAWERLIAEGRIFPIYPNQPVHITGCHGIVCSIITFRYAGKINEIWAVKDAVKVRP